MEAYFHVKFPVFAVWEPVTKAKLDFKNELYRRMRLICKVVVDRLGSEYLHLDRVEGVIASADASKQLRSDFHDRHQDHFIEFNQCHSNCKAPFSLTELKEICTVLKEELEKDLGYQIDEPTIYISLSDL